MTMNNAIHTKAWLLSFFALCSVFSYGQEVDSKAIDESLLGAVPLESIYEGMDGWQLRTHKISVPASMDMPLAGSLEGPAVLYVIEGEISVLSQTRAEVTVVSAGESLELDNAWMVQLRNTRAEESVVIVTDIAQTGSNTVYLAH